MKVYLQEKYEIAENVSAKRESSLSVRNVKIRDGAGFACFVTARDSAGFAPDAAILLRPEDVRETGDYFAIEAHSDFWCRPFWGRFLSRIPKRTQLLMIREGGRFRCWLPVCSDTYKTLIRGVEGGFEFYMMTGCSGLTECRDQLAFLYLEGDDPYIVLRQITESAAELLGNGLKMRIERKFPEVFEYLGWCSWDAFQIRVNHDGLLEKAKEFRDKKVPIRFAILDDMWADVPGLNEIPRDAKFLDMVGGMHRGKMRSFEGDPVRFPKKIKGAIEALHEAGIPDVGIWFPTTGYWNGFAPEAEKTEIGELLLTAPEGKRIVRPESESAGKFFDLLCGKVREWGGSFVKIDNQGFHAHYRERYPVGQSARVIQRAIDGAVGRNFDDRAIINCMGMPSECMFNRPESAVSRCSDDFTPESREWFSKNILQCAYNGLLQGQYYFNDWDMWWTDDEQAAKNSLCHAISGGPIYVSDKVGRTRPEYLLPLAFADGRILRCDDVAVPTADCLFADPRKSGTPLKIRNRVGEACYVAAFNIDKDGKAVAGSVCPGDARMTGRCAYYEYFTGEGGILGDGETVPVTLADNDVFRLYVFIPMPADCRYVLLGRTDKMIGLRAVCAAEGDRVRLYEGGEFGFLASSDVRVFAGDEEIPVEGGKGLVKKIRLRPDETELRFQ